MQPHVPVRCSSIGLFVLKRTSEGTRLLLLKRTQGNNAGSWCQVAGGIEEGEFAWQTALREAQEEIGITLGELYSADLCQQFYRAGSNVISLVPTFVAFVDEHTSITLNAEHSDYRWLSAEEAADWLPFPEQQRALAHIQRYFIDQPPADALKLTLKA